jgi:hypothetical protein
VVGAAPAPDGTLTGFRETRGWAPGRKLFFAMRFSAALVGAELIDRDTNVPYRGFASPKGAEKLGKALEAALDFGALNAPLEVRLLSLASMKRALWPI